METKTYGPTLQKLFVTRINPQSPWDDAVQLNLDPIAWIKSPGQPLLDHVPLSPSRQWPEVSTYGLPESFPRVMNPDEQPASAPPGGKMFGPPRSGLLQ